jgi:hypothetical protein
VQQNFFFEYPRGGEISLPDKQHLYGIQVQILDKEVVGGEENSAVAKNISF